MKSTLAIPAYLAVQKDEECTVVGCIYVPFCWYVPVMVGIGMKQRRWAVYLQETGKFRDCWY